MKKCKNCKWFAEGEEYGNGNECFLSPPVVHQEIYSERKNKATNEDSTERHYNYHSTRPTVDETDFCQFFELKK